MKKTKILGISAFYHDSAVALIEDGKIVYASQEERFSRIKHDSKFPKLALKNLLDFTKTEMKHIDYIIFFEKPFLKFERLLETYLDFAPRGILQFLSAMPIWLKQKLYMKREISIELKKIDPAFNENKLFFSEHHLSHAASAFFPSPFKRSIIFSADGVGEWSTTSVAIGEMNTIKIQKEINFPHSLGLLYSAFTYYIGFKVNSGEYKLMGLAPYGKPIYKDIIEKNLIDIKSDGSFRLNQKYFDYSTGFKMVNRKFNNLFKKPVRKPESQIEKFHMDIAASIQKVTEKVVLKLLKSLKNQYRINNLCLAGGVALNCVINGLIQKEKIFDKIWIQPASGDAGGSLGAALAFWYIHLKKTRVVKRNDNMQGSLLGPKFQEKEIKIKLDKLGAVYTQVKNKLLAKKIAKKILRGNAVGWFQGRMEFGPRALGCRSIIADPTNKFMQKQLNLKIKFRESFRPFAPSVLESEISKWFELDCSSPYMLLVSKVRSNKLLKGKKIKNLNLNIINYIRSKVPGITHVDDSARIQSVNKKNNPIFYELIKEFFKLSGTPMLINTSFNIRGEPIVCTPEDAFNCFMGTNLDILVIENFILEKKQQKKSLIHNYKDKFKLD
tara:strand:- start:6790 stop:8622 length:1833 start_codon:yes stop_codon:yes gene_type:complete